MRTRPTLALLTATAVLAGSGALVVAPAHAYFGPATEVKKLVLTANQVGSAAGWNTSARPLSGQLYQQGPMGWTNVISASGALTATEVRPRSTTLKLASDTDERDFLYDTEVGYLEEIGGATVTSTATSTTVEVRQDAGAGLPANISTVVVRKVGPDGVVVAECVTADPTDSEYSLAGTCASRIATAQAARLTKASPTRKFRTTTVLKKRLLTAAQARKATHLKVGKTKVKRTKAQKEEFLTRELDRDYSARGLKKRKVAYPERVVVWQEGNSFNALGHFLALRGDGYQKIYRSSANHFTIQAGIDHPWMALTVERYRGVLVLAYCYTNTKASVPAASTTRKCSQRLAAAQMKKIRPLYKTLP